MSIGACCTLAATSMPPFSSFLPVVVGVVDAGSSLGCPSVCRAGPAGEPTSGPRKTGAGWGGGGGAAGASSRGGASFFLNDSSPPLQYSLSLAVVPAATTCSDSDSNERLWGAISVDSLPIGMFAAVSALVYPYFPDPPPE